MVVLVVWWVGVGVGVGVGVCVCVGGGGGGGGRLCVCVANYHGAMRIVKSHFYIGLLFGFCFTMSFNEVFLLARI